MQETGVQSLVQEVPLERKWQLTPVFLSGKFHGQRSLVGYSPWGYKELDMTECTNAHTHTHTHTHQHIDPRPIGTRRWMMLTSEILPSYLTTNLSQECPPADQAPWNPLPQLSFKILPWKPLGSWGLLSQSHLFSLLGPLLSESLSRLDQWRVSPVMLCYSPALRPSGNPLTILFLLPLCKIKITEGLSLRDVRS